MSIEQLIAARVRGLRAAQGQSLETLAELSGVSRSMISLIERGEASPTAAVLNKLAGALGITLAALFAVDEDGRASPLARWAEQPVWTDPASGYARRRVSPGGLSLPVELAELTFPAGGSVTFENTTPGAHQQIWILEGEMTVMARGATHHLGEGDCLAMGLGLPVTYANPGLTPARYLLASAAASRPSRRL